MALTQLTDEVLNHAGMKNAHHRKLLLQARDESLGGWSREIDIHFEGSPTGTEESCSHPFYEGIAHR